MTRHGKNVVRKRFNSNTFYSNLRKKVSRKFLTLRVTSVNVCSLYVLLDRCDASKKSDFNCP